MLTWFERYKTVCHEKAIQEDDKYNFVETGFRIGLGHDQWIVTLDPKRQSYLASTNNRQLVTVYETISSDSVALPRMLTLPGVLHQEDWYTRTNLEDDVLVTVSETGYAKDELSLEWLRLER